VICVCLTAIGVGKKAEIKFKFEKEIKPIKNKRNE